MASKPVMERADRDRWMACACARRSGRCEGVGECWEGGKDWRVSSAMDVESLYDPDPRRKSYAGRASSGWRSDAGRRIPPREATRTDPQQRLVLEVSWEALSGRECVRIANDRHEGFTLGRWFWLRTGAGPQSLDGYASTDKGEVCCRGECRTLGLRTSDNGIRRARRRWVALHPACGRQRECIFAPSAGAA